MSIYFISPIAQHSTNNTSALSYSTTTDVSFTFNPTLSISLSNTNITIDNLLPGLSSESSPITVSVGSNTPYGYSLFASVGNSTDYNTTSLVHESNDNSNNNNDNNNNSIPATFTSIATNASLPQLTTDNTWGYSLSSDNGTTWSNYNGLPLYSTVDNNTSTTNPAILIDTKSPADSTESVDFKIAAKASNTQASGTYNNVINFYAVGKPAPPMLYEEVAKMSKGPQTATDLQATITAPISTDYHEDTSNSGVYEYNASVFGESSDASNANKIYYYRGILEPTADQGTYGSDGKATTYPNYVRLGNDTCWRIVRTTGSGGIKMIYNGTWTGSTCANNQSKAQISSSAINSKNSSAVYVGYTYNKAMVSVTTSTSVNTVFGSSLDPTLNNITSTIKAYIENTWYDANNMANYTDKLEPSAGYCNDRTAFSSTTSETLQNVVPRGSPYIIFGSSVRVGGSSVIRTPSLTCPRGNVDIYSYVPTSTTSYTSNELKYPTALLTADEATLAGNGYDNILPHNSKAFLNSGSYYWLLSPNFWNPNGSTAGGFVLNPSGILDGYALNVNRGVRPAISLKPGTTVTSGEGTATDPWLINE